MMRKITHPLNIISILHFIGQIAWAVSIFMFALKKQVLVTEREILNLNWWNEAWMFEEHENFKQYNIHLNVFFWNLEILKITRKGFIKLSERFVFNIWLNLLKWDGPGITHRTDTQRGSIPYIFLNLIICHSDLFNIFFGA